MIDHTGIRVVDVERSKAFYSQALAPLGYSILHQFPGAAGFGIAEGDGRALDPGGDFWVILDEPSVPRNHIAFSAANRAAVDAFYAAAIAAGGKDNGAPGIRTMYHPAYYAAFVYDPDGYNIEAVCHAPQAG
jgi:catechol 2,3-dioxygenase-like lactoylglutathione lyase family enzyme